jgi:adenylate cyclase
MEFNLSGPALDTETPPTVPLRASQACWFLMVDIKGYTSLSAQLPTDVLAQKVGTWICRCRDIIEASGGVVDKFLGDAIFAYWINDADRPAAVAGAIRQIADLQRAQDPEFRVVLHRGLATISGGAGGADNLSGTDVIFVFRMEKVSSKLGVRSIVSAAAVEALPPDLTREPVGSHPVDGFPGVHPFYTLAV